MDNVKNNIAFRLFDILLQAWEMIPGANVPLILFEESVLRNHIRKNPESLCAKLPSIRRLLEMTPRDSLLRLIPFVSIIQLIQAASLAHNKHFSKELVENADAIQDEAKTAALTTVLEKSASLREQEHVKKDLIKPDINLSSAPPIPLQARETVSIVVSLEEAQQLTANFEKALTKPDVLEKHLVENSQKFTTAKRWIERLLTNNEPLSTEKNIAKSMLFYLLKKVETPGNSKDSQIKALAMFLPERGRIHRILEKELIANLNTAFFELDSSETADLTSLLASVQSRDPLPPATS